MRYYHGSGEIFSEFNKNKIGLNHIDSEGGFFFTQKNQLLKTMPYSPQ